MGPECRAARAFSLPRKALILVNIKRVAAPAGSGAQIKLAISLPLVIYWQTLAEAMALLQGTGIPAEKAVSLIADSSAGPTVLKNRAQAVVDTLTGTDQLGTFDISGLAKDLDLALRFAAASGNRLPLSETARASYDHALAEGLGRFDGATLTRMLLG